MTSYVRVPTVGGPGCPECRQSGWLVNPYDDEICKAGDAQGDPRTDKIHRFTVECCEFEESYQVSAEVL